VSQLKKLTGLPIIVRGIMSGIDALQAVGAGASAVWVTSNFSGGASPISIMRQIVATLRGHHMMTEVFMSGGIRRGTDVIKALGFGANAVFLDPETPLWGLY
jgi:isopentenyl diphosphate isomerase/L-lactate dehydrogenase-like FMN-dependent dehydrogenase